MPVVEVNGVAYAHPGGDEIFSEVSFRVATGRHVALVGANGVGKSTLLQLITGELAPTEGSVYVDDVVRRMPQAIGVDDAAGQTVGETLAAFATARLAHLANVLRTTERANDREPSARTGIALAEAVTAWAEAGGYQEEARWDAACQRVLRQPFEQASVRPLSELSGGERKRLVLESLFASETPILLLDEPDNFLDLRGKRWLEAQIATSPKTILFISHDRELLAAAGDAIVTMEGFGAWTHPGSYREYDAARRARHTDLAATLDRWKAEERRLFRYYKLMKQRASVSDGNASRANAAESRWRRFVAAGQPPPPPPERHVRMHLRGSGTGERVLQTEGLEIVGLTEPFDLEIWKGDRVAVLGPNGSGKSHFLRLFGGDAVETNGRWGTGARVHVGLFHQTDEVAWLSGRTPIESLGSMDLTEEQAMGALARYGLQDGARRPFETLSGGQRARLQVLGLELRGVNLLLLDEPTDNLDLDSAEALEAALDDFEGTVLCVTHDRWFLRGFDRYVLFDHDCTVKEVLDLDSSLHLLTGDASYAFRAAAVTSLVASPPT